MALLLRRKEPYFDRKKQLVGEDDEDSTPTSPELEANKGNIPQARKSTETLASTPKQQPTKEELQREEIQRDRNVKLVLPTQSGEDDNPNAEGYDWAVDGINSIGQKLSRGIPNSSEKHRDQLSEMWKMYVHQSENVDRGWMRKWTTQMEGTMVFATLFSSVITSFILNYHEQTAPDPTVEALVAFQALSQQMTLLTAVLLSVATPQAGAAASIPPIPFSVEQILASQYTPSPNRDKYTYNLIVLYLWYISLLLSIACALLSLFVNGWILGYDSKISEGYNDFMQARLRRFFLKGMDRFGLRAFVTCIPFLLHASLFLFFVGLSISTHDVNGHLGYMVISVTGFFGVCYMLLSLVFFFSSDAPYDTPITQCIKLLMTRCFNKDLDEDVRKEVGTTSKHVRQFDDIFQILNQKMIVGSMEHALYVRGTSRIGQYKPMDPVERAGYMTEVVNHVFKSLDYFAESSRGWNALPFDDLQFTSSVAIHLDTLETAIGDWSFVERCDGHVHNFIGDHCWEDLASCTIEIGRLKEVDGCEALASEARVVGMKLAYLSQIARMSRSGWKDDIPGGAGDRIEWEKVPADELQEVIKRDLAIIDPTLLRVMCDFNVKFPCILVPDAPLRPDPFDKGSTPRPPTAPDEVAPFHAFLEHLNRTRLFNDVHLLYYHLAHCLVKRHKWQEKHKKQQPIETTFVHLFCRFLDLAMEEAENEARESGQSSAPGVLMFLPIWFQFVFGLDLKRYEARVLIKKMDVYEESLFKLCYLVPGTESQSSWPPSRRRLASKMKNAIRMSTQSPMFVHWGADVSESVKRGLPLLHSNHRDFVAVRRAYYEHLVKKGLAAVVEEVEEMDPSGMKLDRGCKITLLERDNLEPGAVPKMMGRNGGLVGKLDRIAEVGNQEGASAHTTSRKERQPTTWVIDEPGRRVNSFYSPISAATLTNSDGGLSPGATLLVDQNENPFDHAAKSSTLTSLPPPSPTSMSVSGNQRRKPQFNAAELSV